LNVTSEAQILEIIRALEGEMHMAVIFISHDMGVVAEVAERVVVMYQGANVEEGSAEAIFHSPQHPYTKALLAAVPKLGAMHGTDRPARFPLLAGNGAATPPRAFKPHTPVASAPLLTVRS